MKRILYIDAPFGISGDMLIAGLVGKGGGYQKLTRV